MYTVSNMMISNLKLTFERFEPKCPNLGILGQKVLTF